MNQDKKSLTISKPYLFLIMGIPGAGKTFFAQQFSETFSAPFLNMNDLRYELFDEPDFSVEQENKLEKLSHKLAAEIMKTKTAFIVEGKLDARADRLEYMSLAHKHGYKTILVWVQNVEATAKNRAIKDPLKNKSHVITEEIYNKITSKFTSPNVRENPVVISGKHTFATQAKIVLKRVADAHVASENVKSQSRVYPNHKPIIIR